MKNIGKLGKALKYDIKHHIWHLMTLWSITNLIEIGLFWTVKLFESQQYSGLKS